MVKINQLISRKIIPWLPSKLVLPVVSLMPLNMSVHPSGFTADKIPALAPPNRQRKELNLSSPIFKSKGITKGKKSKYSSYQKRKVLIVEAKIVSPIIIQFRLFFQFSWLAEAKKSCNILLFKKA